jgi:DnaJ family protein C protein 17
VATRVNRIVNLLKATNFPTGALYLETLDIMPSDDLLDHAKSDQDFYALLGEGIHEGSTEKEISRAYRRSALKHHPDQNANDPNAVSRFHALQIAYDVLSDPAARAAYNEARRAREARKRHHEMLQGKRRAMKEDLERRESGAFKRKRDEMEAEERLEQELRRLAEDGRRRRKEREEALKREQAADMQKVSSGDEETPKATQFHQEQPGVRETGVPEISRTVKVRWPREGIGLDLDKQRFEGMFGKFGKVENTLILKDRKMRIGNETKKRLVATGVVVFQSIVGAYAAVEDLKRQPGDEWKIFESIEWAEGKEPVCLNPQTSSASTAIDIESTPQTPSHPAEKLRKSFMNSDSTPKTPRIFANGLNDHAQSEGKNEERLRKVPSFASFSSAKLNSPASSPFARGPQSPSLEEITMIRLKNAEKKRLEEQIRKEEAQEQERGSE